MKQFSGSLNEVPGNEGEDIFMQWVAFLYEAKDAELYSETENLIMQNFQHEAFHEEIEAIRENRAVVLPVFCALEAV